ncbi:MAG: carboxypeptidase-like regulatory domain-containing protein [Planctomycetota bacterium]
MSSRIVVILILAFVAALGVWFWRVATSAEEPTFEAQELAAEDREGAAGGARRRGEGETETLRAEGEAGDGGRAVATTPTDDGDDPDLAHVSVRVVDDASGQPIAGCPVLLEPRTMGPRAASDGEVRTTKTDRDGRARIGAPGPLRFELRVQSPRHADHLVPASLNPGEDLDLGEVRLKLGAEVRGRVTDEAGRGLGGVDVLAWVAPAANEGRPGFGMANLALGNDDRQARRTVTAADGGYAITGLAEGAALVRARPEGRPDAERRDVAMTPGALVENVDFVIGPGRELRGQVVKLDGTPVAGARVEIDVDRGGGFTDFMRRATGIASKYQATSDAQGAFAIPGLDPELNYRATAEALGYFTERRVAVPDEGALEIRLAPGALVEVRVKDASGEPLAEPFEITCDRTFPAEEHRARPFYGADAADLLSIADEPGLACIADVRGDRVRFTVSAAGRADAVETESRIGSGERRVVEVTLARAFRVAGRVVDERGEPVVRATVTARAMREEGGNPFAREDMNFPFGGRNGPQDALARARTDERGHFVLEKVPEGSIEIAARHSRFVSSDPEEVGISADVDGLELTLRTPATVRGTVFDAQGAPLPRGRVTMTQEREPGAGPFGRNRREVTADAEGRYAFPGVSAGRYRLVAAAPGGAGAPRGMFFGGMDPGSDEKGTPVEVQLGDDVVVDVRLEPKGAIEGSVRAGGEAVGGVTVQLRSRAGAPGRGGGRRFGPPMAGQRARADQTGRFRFEQVEKGEYEAIVTVPGLSREITRDVSIVGVETARVEFDLPGGGISGRVVDAASGEPVKGARIRLVDLQREEDPNLPPEAREAMRQMEASTADLFEQMSGRAEDGSRTDADGAFRLTFLEPGRYRMEVRAAGFEDPAPREFNVGDRMISGQTFSLTRGATLTVRVESKGQLPAGTFPFASILLKDSAGKVVKRQVSGLGATTKFTGVPAGDYDVEVTVGERVVSKPARIASGTDSAITIDLD